MDASRGSARLARRGPRAASTMNEHPDLNAGFARVAFDACVQRAVDGTILAWNEAATTLYGYSAGEAVGQSCDRLLKTTQPPPPAPDAHDTAPAWNGVLHRMARDGTDRIVEVRLQPVRQADGTVLVLEVARDLTDTRRRQEELRTSQERFARAFRHSPIGLLLTHLDSDVIVDANDAFLTIIGRTRSEVLGRSLVELNLLDEPSFFGPFADELRQHGYGREHQLRLRRRDGDWREVLVDAQTAEFADATFVLALVRDVTETIRATAALRSAHHLTHQVIDCALEGIFVVDAAGRIEVWNHFLAELFDLPPAAAAGREAGAVMREALSDGFHAALERVLHGGPFESFERFVTTPAVRRPLWLAVRIAPLRESDGRPRGAIVTMHDISAHKHLQQRILNAIEREKQRISQDLHDELGQQITAISLLLEGARAQPAAAGRSAVDRSIALLKEAHAGIRAIVRGLQPVGCGPGGLRDALRTLAQQEDAAGRVRVHFECPEDVPLESTTVALQLFRIAQEALNNAIKHADAHLIVISLHRRGNELTLSVRDNGRGVAPATAVGGGVGLRIMRFRAESIGAHFEFAALHPRGSLVICRLALDRIGDGRSEP